MRFVALVGLSYVALVLDAGSGRWGLGAGTAPHFLFLVAALALLWCESIAAIVWAGAIGILSDAVSGAPLGLNVVLLANLAFFAQIFGMRSAKDSVFASGGVIWALSTLAIASSLAVQAVLHGQSLEPAWLLRYAAGRAGANAALFVAIMLTWKTTAGGIRMIVPSVRVGRDRRGWLAGGA